MAKKESNRGSGKWSPKGATQATVSYNPVQNGIEVRFNGELTEELKSKLRVFGFRPSKLTGLWYATKSEETTAFANAVTEFLPTEPEGPTLHLSPSFDPIKPNVEKKEFSYISISLKDGQNKSYILFEPSKPKADVIALEFAKKEFGNQFLGLVVKPRTNLREARLLFEEGKIMLPSLRHSPKETNLKELERKVKTDELEKTDILNSADEGIIADKNKINQTAVEVNIPATYKEPWMMEQSEFLDYVQDYVKRFRVYPVDVLEMFDILVRKFPGNEKLLSEKSPSKETLEKVVKLVHLLHIYKAIAKGREVSPSIIAKDYPGLLSKALPKFPQPVDRLEYGFDATNFKTPENFLTLLQSVGVSSECKKCSYLHYPFASPPVYLWRGEGIRFVTANNPLLAEGQASLIGVEGTKARVLKAVQYIESHTNSKGKEGLEYIDFENLFCIDPDDPFFGLSGGPSDDGHKTKETSGNPSQEVNSENTQEEVTGIPNETIYQKPKHKFSSVTEVSRSLITTRPEIFQGRETDYAQETVDKIVREGFDKSQEPIIVWRDENGKLVVISGHSRWEASRRLFEAGDDSLGTMPLKIYQGTLAEAMDFALLESNRGVTQEGLKSDLRAYKYAKLKGYNREYLKGIFKPESRLKLLEDISHLNEAGSFLSHIDTEAEKSFPYLQRNAHWVGQIRKQFPALTNSHEEEMFGYLYGLNNESKKAAGKKLIVTKGQFFELIEKKVSRIDFQSNKPLNLDQIISANVLTDPAKERIHEIERDIDKLERERLQKDELIVRAFKEKNDTLVEKFRDRQGEINQIITWKILEKEKIEREIGILEKTSIDLFSSSLDNELESSTQNAEESTIEYPVTEDQSANEFPEPNPAPSFEVPSASESMQQSASEEQRTKASEDYIDRIVAIMHGRYASSERATKKEIENLADELGISNMGRIWEAVELSWLLWYQMIYKQPIAFESRLSQMINFWNKIQPIYAYSDSSKEIYKQYSTPCPIGAIVAQYTGMDNSKSVFDPSAGNGLLVLGANPSSTHVNEIDSTRIESLKFQGFKSITNFNATQPFPEEYTRSFDIVVTNPPFTKWDEDQFDKDILVQQIFDHHIGLNFHLRLEHVMAGIALHCMKDSGKAAIILMNHIYFDPTGYIGKYRPFFNWLYRHYKVDDVINMNSYKLYNKQGAIQKTMLVLIDGRKPVLGGVAPRKEDAPHLEEMVDTFEELWKRVKVCITRSQGGDTIDKIIQQLTLAISA